MTPLSDVETAAVARARRRLCDPLRDVFWDGDHEAAARQALTILQISQEFAPDPPIAAELHQPAWNADSGLLPVVPVGPLLGLLEETA